MILQWVVVAICAVLWRLGGWKWKICRHLVPAVLGLYLALYLELWWMFLVVGALGQVVSIGYGIPDSTDPGSWLGRLVVKIFGPANAGWITRGVAGAIYAIFIGFGPIFLSGVANDWVWPALFYVQYPIYIFFNFTVGGLLSYFKVKDYIIEPAIGAAIAMLVIVI